MTPLIVPGAGGDSPLFTWGDICGTPLNLDPSRLESVGGSSAKMSASSSSSAAMMERGMRFEIKPISKRESVAHELMGNAAKKKRSNSGSVACGSRVKRKQPLTPAALALADRLRGMGGGGPATPFGGGLSMSYK